MRIEDKSKFESKIYFLFLMAGPLLIIDTMATISAPFHALRWDGGSAEILQGGHWVELVAVNDSSADELAQRAVERTGTAFVERIEHDLQSLLGDAYTGPAVRLTLRSTDGEVYERWARMSWWKYQRLTQSGARRRSVSRERAAGAGNPELRWLTPDRNSLLTSNQIDQDLRALEWLLEERFAYRNRAEVDLQAMLDDLYAIGAQGMARVELAVRLQQLMAQLQDGHTRVRFGKSNLQTPSGWLPCLPVRLDDGIACLEERRRGFLDDRHPLLHSLDGIAIQDWLEVAGALVAAPSEPYHRLHTTQTMRNVSLLRLLMSSEANSRVDISLMSEEGERDQVEMPLASSPVPDALYRPVEHQILPGGIGLLELRAGMLPAATFHRPLTQAMLILRNTRALIIDIRGNRGGHRAVLSTLLPYFIQPEELPKVVNIAAYRMDRQQRPSDEVEVLSARTLYPMDSPRWTEAERQAIYDVQAGFNPEIDVDPDHLSPWHYMVIGHLEDGARPYLKPVFVLQDEACFSATSLFAAAMASLLQVTLLGQRCGGGSGFPIQLQLPESGIVVQVSSMVSLRPDGTRYEGVSPDIELEYTAEVLRQQMLGPDPWLETALQLARPE